MARTRTRKVDCGVNFCRERRLSPSKFDPRSFRTKAVGPRGTKIVLGCPRGEWKPRVKRCAVPMQLQTVLRPASSEKCRAACGAHTLSGLGRIQRDPEKIRRAAQREALSQPTYAGLAPPRERLLEIALFTEREDAGYRTEACFVQSKAGLKGKLQSCSNWHGGRTVRSSMAKALNEFSRVLAKRGGGRR